MKNVAGEKKITEKLRQQRKAANSSKPHPGSLGVRAEAKDTIIM
jgi:hypothetical protein